MNDNVIAIFALVNGPMPKGFCRWDSVKTKAFKRTVEMARKAARKVEMGRAEDSSIKGELYALQSFWI